MIHKLNLKVPSMRSRSRLLGTANKVSELPVLVRAGMLYQFSVDIEPPLARITPPIQFRCGECCLRCGDPGPVVTDSFLGFTGPDKKFPVLETEDGVIENRNILQYIEPCASVCAYLTEPLVDLVVILNPVPIPDAVDRVFTAGLRNIVEMPETCDAMECIVNDRNGSSCCTVNAVKVIRFFGIRVIRRCCGSPVTSDFLNPC